MSLKRVTFTRLLLRTIWRFKMDYLSQKLQNFQFYTSMTYYQYSKILGVPQSTLYSTLRDPDYTTYKARLVNNFHLVLETIRAQPETTTIYPDLFLPCLPNCQFALYIMGEGSWFGSPDFRNLPMLSGTGNYIYNENKKLYNLAALGLPEFPSMYFSGNASLYEQTNSGWVSVYPDALKPTSRDRINYIHQLKEMYKNTKIEYTKFKKHY